MAAVANGDMIKEFRRVQDELKKKLRLPCEGGGVQMEDIRFIGACDISFSLTEPDKIAFAAIAIYRWSDFDLAPHQTGQMGAATTKKGNTTTKPVYLAVEQVELTMPYLAGFLAFRETPHYLKLLNDLKVKRPELYPQVLLVDGNGILHCAEFGCASHLGVLTSLATVGVGKTFFNVDGLNEDIVQEQYKKACQSKGDTIPIEGKSGKVWGAVIKNTPEYPSKNCLYISVGHDIHLDTAIAVVQRCLFTGEPEPIRRADLAGRDAARKFDSIPKPSPKPSPTITK
jgi:endonuclease V